MSELADEADSKSVVGNNVWVQVPSPAVYNGNPNLVPMGTDSDFSYIFIVKSKSGSIVSDTAAFVIYWRVKQIASVTPAKAVCAFRMTAAYLSVSGCLYATDRK